MTVALTLYCRTCGFEHHPSGFIPETCEKCGADSWTTNKPLPITVQDKKFLRQTHIDAEKDD